jgi:GTP-binding protein
MSATTGQRAQRILPLVLEVQAARQKRIPTHEVNEVLRELMSRSRPPHSQGRAVKIQYATQVATAPPTFVLWSNLPEEISESYKRYLHNGFRERWGFVGSPIRINLRRKHEEDAA